MKDGQCPRCHSYEVHSGADIGWKGGPQINMIPIGAGLLRSSTVALDNYLFVNCGYVESYISDARALRDIAQTWPRVIHTPEQ